MKDIARDHQVIYLTTSDRYDKLADHVVELPTPTEKDELEVVATAAGPAETLTVWSTATLPKAVQKAPRANPDGNGNGHPAPVPAEPAVGSGSAVEHAPLWPAEEN